MLIGLQPRPVLHTQGSPNTMVPKYTEYFLVQRITQHNRPLTAAAPQLLYPDRIQPARVGHMIKSHDISSSAGQWAYLKGCKSKSHGIAGHVTDWSA